jgi:ribosomal protein S7
MVQKSLKNRMINLKMKKGKKSICEKQMLAYFKLLQKSNRKNINFLFKQVLIKTTPTLSLRKVTRNSDDTIKYYPHVLKKSTRIALSLRLLIKPPSVFDCLASQDWFNMLNDKLITKSTSQDQVMQHKKLSRYRWFV